MTILFVLILIDSLLFAMRRIAAPQGVAMLVDFLFWMLFCFIIRGVAL